MERQKDGTYVKKGPWSAEEDEILINYVNKFGPRDWSSLRSKSLLPRTGKSCRLRWVNKLRPNLKTGCKFTAEEERVVIELQAEFGNKWAKIATYLPGRTDNDVKNFWSTRRKRLERLLQNPSQKYQKNKQRIPEFQELLELPALEIPSYSSSQLDEQSSNWKDHFQNDFQLGNSEMHNMVNMETENQTFGASSIKMTTPHDPFSYNCISQFTQFPQEIPVFTECRELAPNSTRSNLQDLFDPGEPSGMKSRPEFVSSSMPVEQEIKPESEQGVKIEEPYYANPDDLFDDFSTDFFDFFDQPPTSLNWEFNNDKAL